MSMHSLQVLSLVAVEERLVDRDELGHGYPFTSDALDASRVEPGLVGCRRRTDPA